MPELPEGWFAAGGVLTGFVAKSLADLLQHRFVSERERAAREAAAKSQMQERRDAFQRQTLLALQEALMDLARTEGSMQTHDVRAFRETNQWHKNRYGEELSEQNRIANALISKLVVRVRDDRVRQQVQLFRDNAFRVFSSSSLSESEQALTKMGAELEAANQRIGEILRTLDEHYAE